MTKEKFYDFNSRIDYKKIADAIINAANRARTHWEITEYGHVNRAICFALEQKPDTIFMLTTKYEGMEASIIRQSLIKFCKEFYGPDRRKYPTINVTMLARSSISEGYYTRHLNNILEIATPFHGQGKIIPDIRDFMTVEERRIMEDMNGKF